MRKPILPHNKSKLDTAFQRGGCIGGRLFDLQGFLFQFVVMLALLRELRSEFRQRIPFVLLPLQQSAVDRGVDAVGEFSDRILTRAI